MRRRPGYAVTLKDDEGLRGTPGFPAEEFRVLAPRKCVFSMLHIGLEESGPKLLEVRDFIPVSYTHLDVYKRQVSRWETLIEFFIMRGHLYAAERSYDNN